MEQPYFSLIYLRLFIFVLFYSASASLIIANSSSRFISLVPWTAWRTMPFLSTTMVSGKPSVPIHDIIPFASTRCVHVKWCLSVIRLAVSASWKVAEKNITLGSCSFQVESSGISARHGPQPEYHRLSTMTRPFTLSFVHMRPSVDGGEQKQDGDDNFLHCSFR